MENLASKSTSASNLEAFALSDVGCIRTNNEDNFVCQTLWTDNYLLLAAIDGVGGQEGGEVASAIAAESLSHYLETYTNGDALQLLKQAVRQANDDIFDQRLQRPEVSRMSCVLTSAIVDGHNRLLHMAHVGDTRLYIFVDGKLRKLSHDHSLVGYREEIGDLTEEEAMHHPQRNLISRDVGSERFTDDSFVEGETFPLPTNSTLLLCSDGLTDLLTAAEITAILQQKVSVEQKCHQLVDSAKAAGGKDNVTVVLAHYTGAGNPEWGKCAARLDSQSPEALKAQASKQAAEQTLVNVAPTETLRTEAVKEPIPPQEENTQPVKRSKRRLRRWVLALLMLLIGLAIGFCAGRYTAPKPAPEPVDTVSKSNDSIHDTSQHDSISDSVSDTANKDNKKENNKK